MSFLGAYGESKRFLDILSTLATAAETAANAYAKSVEGPAFVVNINHEPNINSVADITDAVKRVVNQGRVQDR